ETFAVLTAQQCSDILQDIHFLKAVGSELKLEGATLNETLLQTWQRLLRREPQELAEESKLNYLHLIGATGELSLSQAYIRSVFKHVFAAKKHAVISRMREFLLQNNLQEITAQFFIEHLPTTAESWSEDIQILVDSVSTQRAQQQYRYQS